MATARFNRRYEAKLGEYRLLLLRDKGEWFARLSGYASQVASSFRERVGQYPEDLSLRDLQQQAERDARAYLARRADPAADRPMSEWRALADPNERFRNREAEMKAERDAQRTREEQLLKRRDFISNYIVVLTLLTTITATVYFFYSSRGDRANLREIEATARLQSQMAQLDTKYNNLLQSFKQQASTTDQDKAISALRADLNNVKQRVSDFEAAIGDDAPKRIAVVTLRKDIDTIKDEHRADILALRDEYTRLMDFLKWVVGIIAASGILSTIFTFFSKAKEAKPVA